MVTKISKIIVIIKSGNFVQFVIAGMLIKAYAIFSTKG